MKKTMVFLGSMVLVGALAVSAFAHGPGWGKGYHGRGYWRDTPGHCWQYGRAYENLTGEQRAQLDTLHRKFHDETAELRKLIWSKSAELNSLLNSPSPDAEKAKALQDEISDLKARVAQKRMDLGLEARKIAPEVSFGRWHGRGLGRHMEGYGPDVGYGRHMRGHGPRGHWK